MAPNSPAVKKDHEHTMTAITTTAVTTVTGSVNDIRDHPRWRVAKACIAKADRAQTRADDLYISAGRHLIALKAAHHDCGGTFDEWEALLKEQVGIGKSRASDLMQIANGTKTVESVRADSARRVRETEKRKKISPLASGGNAADPKASAEKRRAEYAAADVAEEESFLDDSGDYAPADPNADAQGRIRGFLYRAQQSAFAAETDKLKGLDPTREMLEAAEKAAQAWAGVLKELQRRQQGDPGYGYGSSAL